MKSLLGSRLVPSLGLLLTTIWLCGVPHSTARAQVPPEAVNTDIVETTRAGFDLGTRTTATVDLTTNVTTTAITGGSRPDGGSNLFHSFDFFTVGTNDIAHFQNDMMLPTTNIIARVIGDAAGLRAASTIDGILRTNTLNALDPLNFGSANLFLVNPAGIIFGPNAQLDIKGSFAATTADYLRMTDGAQFHANLVQPSVLTIADVASFGFTSPRPVAIAVQGSNLTVATGQSLMLAGGDLTITGGPLDPLTFLPPLVLEAPSGRIQLASVASAGEVVIASGQVLDLSSFSSQGQIEIISSFLDASGESGGAIEIKGRSVLFDESVLFADTLGAIDGLKPGVTIEATEDIVVDNFSLITSDSIGSGASGGVTVKANNLLVDNGSVIQSDTFGPGASGVIKLNANSILVDNESLIESTTSGPGDSGGIHVEADTLELNNSFGIFAITTGDGNAGDIEVTTNRLTVKNSLIQTHSILRDENGTLIPTIKGNGGDILINTKTLDLLQGGRVVSDTMSDGHAGDVTINAENVLVEGRQLTAPFFPSEIRLLHGFDGFSGSGGGTGDSGNLTVNARSLVVRDGARITTEGVGPGKHGDITLNVDNILLSSGPQSAYPFISGTGIVSSSTSVDDVVGEPGTIRITGQRVELNDGAVISSTTRVRDAGDIVIDADQVLITGQNQSSVSFISASTIGSGRGGTIRITGESVEVSNGGLLASSTSGTGAGGTIQIDADQVLVTGWNTSFPLSLPSLISVSTLSSGEGGNIAITGSNIDVLDGARLLATTTLSGHAGNIILNGDQITVAGVQGGLFQSGLFASTAPNSTGGGGTIQFTGGRVEVSDGGLLSATTSGSGAGGTIQIEADQILITGVNRSGATPRQSILTTSTVGSGQGGDVLLGGNNITLADGATVTAETSGKGKAGNVTLTGDTLTVASGGRIEAGTTGEGNGGSIAIAMTGDVTVSGVSTDGQTRSGIFAKTQTSSGTAGGGSGGGGSGGGSGGGGTAAKPGNAGNITIASKNLLLTGGAQIDSSTTSGGAGGNVSITTAENITIAGSSTRLTSDATRGDGKGGSITLVAKNITVRDNASVTAATGGKGDAGNISLTALGQLLLQSAGTITTSTSGSGKGGTIVIQASQVLLDGFGTGISADTLRPFADLTITINILHPNDGDLVVQLDSPTGTRVALFSRVGGSSDNFTGTQFNDQATTQITSGSAPFTGTFKPREPLGQLINELVAGNWALNVRDQATGNPLGTLESWTLQIGTQTFQSTGGSKVIPDNGNVRSPITVAAPTVPTVQGVGEAPGIGGNVTVTAGTVTVRNGATLSATTRGSGQGGTLTVNATGPVALAGSGSGLFTDSEASGAGGNINVKAARMTMDNGATVSAASSSTGDAGTITINAGSEFLSTNSSITTESLNASGGNITLLATDMIHFKNSQITASVLGGPTTAGGNILIDPNFIILQNSQIIAQAIQGAGGNIDLTFNQALLTDARSTISASSQFGVSGTVNINSPAQNLSDELVPLEQSFLSGNTLSNQRCAARMAEGQISTFIVTEREGLPQEPGGMLLSSLVENDGTAVSETIEPIRVASVSQLPFTQLTPEPVQLTRTDNTCRR